MRDVPVPDEAADPTQHKENDMTTIQLQFIADARHAWLKISRKEAALVNMPPPSQYSYQDSEYLYLEEDMDAYKFIVAAESAGIEIVEPATIFLSDNSDRNEIRRLEHCP